MSVALNKLSLPLKWHGGKHYLTKGIIELMPKHSHYVEPYCGGAAVLLAKDPEGVSEVINDIDGRLTNFWRVLQDEGLFARFFRRMEAMPFSEAEWDAAHERASTVSDDPVADAVAFFVECRQSLAGRRKCFTSITHNRLRRGMNEQASAWQTAIAGLPAVSTRLKRVVILNRPALNVMQSSLDTPDTLFYLDPPYLHQTRAARKVYGPCEMSDLDHRDMLDVLPTLKGKVMLSGYPSDLYDSALAGWNRDDFDRPNNAAGGASKRRMTDCVWCNF